MEVALGLVAEPALGHLPPREQQILAMAVEQLQRRLRSELDTWVRQDITYDLSTRADLNIGLRNGAVARSCIT